GATDPSGHPTRSRSQPTASAPRRARRSSPDAPYLVLLREGLRPSRTPSARRLVQEGCRSPVFFHFFDYGRKKGGCWGPTGVFRPPAAAPDRRKVGVLPRAPRCCHRAERPPPGGPRGGGGRARVAPPPPRASVPPASPRGCRRPWPRRPPYARASGAATPAGGTQGDRSRAAFNTSSRCAT